MSDRLWQRLGAASGIVYAVTLLGPDLIQGGPSEEPGVKEVLEKKDPKLAENPLIFPPDEVAAKLHPYPALSPKDEQTMQEAMAKVTGA